MRRSSEHLTADDRAILRTCYASCPCAGCKMRREVIEKAVRIIDGDEPYCASNVGQHDTKAPQKEQG